MGEAREGRAGKDRKGGRTLWRAHIGRAMVMLWAWCLAPLALAQPTAADDAPVEVALAGLAYAGAENMLDARFPYSRRFEQDMQAAGTPIARGLADALRAMNMPHLRLTEGIEQIKGRDQALAVALVVGSEVVSVEPLGGMHKLMVLVRGQAMFFDFKSMRVVRAHPISFAYIDTLPHAPSAEEIMVRVRWVYQGANGKPGVLARFVDAVARARVRTDSPPRYLQVTSVQVGPQARPHLPAFLRAASSPGVPAELASAQDPAETWVADMVAEALSTRTGVPLVPYAKGYAIGNVMSLRVADGTVWSLELPSPDYVIGVELSEFRKVKLKEIVGGATAFGYGAYVHLRLEEPLSRKVFLSTSLKNGLSRVIPASQSYVDDAPHFYDSLNDLLVKLALALDGRGDGAWLRGAAAAPDIERQLSQTQELMKQCK